MPLSFHSLWEQMEKNPLMTSGLDSQALTVVRAGENLHEKDTTSFWDEFINLCSNREGMAELFDVSADKISNWPSRIKDHLEKVKKVDVESPSEPEETEMIPTGDNGAFTATNQDPYIGEI